MAEDSTNIKEQTLLGVKWTALEQFCTQLITFVMGIILARLLSPSDYGIIGILAVFMSVSQTFIDSGFGQALIRKTDFDDTDCSTVFFFNLMSSIICYFALFASSPLIADFFNMPVLSPIVKVYCLTLIIGSIESVQITRLTAFLNFKVLAKVNVLSNVISGGIGIFLAYMGYGVWALVWQSMSYRIFHVIVIWIVAKWHPSLVFSRQSFLSLFGFGSKILASALLWQIYSNLIPIVIGKFFSARDLGFYNRGTSLASVPSNMIVGVFEKVTYPVMAKIQRDHARLVSVYRKYIKYTSMVIIFVLVLLAALAKPIVTILLTDKWSDCIIYLQIFVFSAMFNHIQKLNLNLLKVVGRSDYVLKIEVYKRIISVVMLLVSIPLGVIGICISMVIYEQIALAFNTYYTGKLFGLGYWSQIKDFMPYVVLSMLACITSYLITFTSLPCWSMLMIGGTFSPLFYWLLLKLKNDESYVEFVKPAITKYVKR